MTAGGMQETGAMAPADLRQGRTAAPAGAPLKVGFIFSEYPKTTETFIMRDVTLWAFTQPFFWEREDELKEFEMEMADLPMSVDAYLAQLNVI